LVYEQCIEEVASRKMRVRVNKDLCSACGVCEGLVPEVFSLETEPYAVVLLDPVPEELEDAVREAAENCPEGAIEIVEED
jgi:ferredoxin